MLHAGWVIEKLCPRPPSAQSTTTRPSLAHSSARTPRRLAWLHIPAASCESCQGSPLAFGITDFVSPVAWPSARYASWSSSGRIQHKKHASPLSKAHTQLHTNPRFKQQTNFFDTRTNITSTQPLHRRLRSTLRSDHLPTPLAPALRFVKPRFTVTDPT